MKKPDNVSTAGALLIAGGIMSLLVSLGLALGTLGCWVPAWAFGIPCAIYTIVKGFRLLGDNAYGMGTPRAAAILEIIQIVNMDIIGMILGIIALVMLSDADAEAYLNATRPLESFQPGGGGVYRPGAQPPGYGASGPGYGAAGYGAAGYGAGAPGQPMGAPPMGATGGVGPVAGPPPFAPPPPSFNPPPAAPAAPATPASSFVPRQWGDEVPGGSAASNAAWNTSAPPNDLRPAPPAQDPWKASVGMDDGWDAPSSGPGIKAEPAASASGYQVAPWGATPSSEGAPAGRAEMRKTVVEQAVDVSNPPAQGKPKGWGDDWGSGS